jgi:predicted methyltransferase
MPRLTELAHDAIRSILRPGEIAIDATAGNGHDTLFLAELVGPNGRVFAFDVQSAALERTAERLQAAGITHVTLFARCHSELATVLPRDCSGQVGAVMFNLGYLPGGEKTVVTQPETSVSAIAAALDLMRLGGVLTVIAYIGHPGGADETAAVRQFLHALPRLRFTTCEVGSENATGPVLFVVRTHTRPV